MFESEFRALKSTCNGYYYKILIIDHVSTDMRKHLKTHSYSGNYYENLVDNFDCSDCNFTVQWKYGDTLEDLEIHLVSCEIYECSFCEIGTRFLHEVKTHIEKNHDSSKLLFHLKMNRENQIKVDFKSCKINEV